MKIIKLCILTGTLIMTIPFFISEQQINATTNYKSDNEVRHKLDNEARNKLARVVKEAKIPMFQAAFSNKSKAEFFEFTNEGYISPAKEFKTVFQAASLSKPLFVYIVMKMAGNNEIDLDKPIIDYLGQDRFLPDQLEWAKVLTARVILTHKSGLPNWAASPSSEQWPSSSLIFKFKPDSAFSYSGEAFTLLQKVVEKIKDESLQNIAIKEVFMPLGMNSSSFEWGREDITTLDYDRIAADGFNNEGENKGKGRHPRASSAYTLRTTASDYSLLLEALIKGVGLTPQYHKEIFTPQIKAVRYSDRDRICDNSIFWGLGLGIEKNNELGDVYFHWGDNGNFKALFIIVPSQESHLVYLTNSANGHSIIDSVTPLFFGNKEPLAISSWVND